MNLVYFESDIGNFGDDLNPWLWEKIFGSFNKYQDLDFIGIGSILDYRIFNDRKKVIFGSGIRSLSFDKSKLINTEALFVRGPISARQLDTRFICDSAYCLGLIDKDIEKKKYKTSFIPYFRQWLNFNWTLFSALTGYHVINPTQHVSQVISEIKSSEKIITSAMHGAILADVYRVPWQRCKFSTQGFESQETSILKWNDFQQAVSVKNDDFLALDFDINSKFRFKRYNNNFKIPQIAYKLRQSNYEFNLSPDSVLDSKLNQLEEAVHIVIKKYKL